MWGKTQKKRGKAFGDKTHLPKSTHRNSEQMKSN